MKFLLDTTNAHYSIKRYSSTTIVLNDNTEYNQSLIISPTTLITDWPPQTLADLQPEHFASVLTLNPSVFLLGVGEFHQFPNPQLLQPFYQQHIGVEVMTTAAACRTFNVLAAEGRAVVAALLKG